MKSDFVMHQGIEGLVNMHWATMSGDFLKGA